MGNLKSKRVSKAEAKVRQAKKKIVHTAARLAAKKTK
jgi:hypothetical protein